MKLTTLIILIAFMQVSAKTYSQITLHVNNKPLTEVLETVKQQTGFVFFYEGHLLDDINVSVDLNNVGLRDAMDKCLMNLPLSYTIVKKNVVITLRTKLIQEQTKPTFQTPVTVAGKVTDSLGTPLIGATITNERLKKTTITNDIGEFSIEGNYNDILIFSYVGYKPVEIKVTPNALYLTIILNAATNGLKEVVVNTGYQRFSLEKATGSFSTVDNNVYNLRTGANVIDRLQGNVPGLLFNLTGTLTGGENSINRDFDLNVRGHSTLFANDQPLIVVDNFPYDGDINNLNPNDVENVTVLKDAAAAAIWGVRSGNGVIVITTKKGKRNQPLKIEFNGNVTVGNKPDLFYAPGFLDASDFINAEQKLFNLGYYDGTLSDPSSLVSPVVDILNKERSNLINQQSANAMLNSLKNFDVRKDLSKYFYRKSIDQQYYLNFRGGNEKSDYFFSFGEDNGRSNKVGNSNNRIGIVSKYNLYPLKNLRLSAEFDFTKSDAYNNFVPPANLYPYSQIVQADGTPLVVPNSFSPDYKATMESSGLLNWDYKPLAELRGADNHNTGIDNLFKIGATYSFLNGIDFQVNYQYEKSDISSQNYSSIDSYYTRNLINEFTIVGANGSLSSPIPRSGILNSSDNYLFSHKFRTQFDVSEIWNKHQLNLIGGVGLQHTVSQSSSSTAYGYDSSTYFLAPQIDFFNYYDTNPYGSAQVPTSAGVSKSTNNYLEYFINANYTFDNKYTVSSSAVINHTNLFGVNTNQKAVPIYSFGLAWNLDKENFYHVDLIPVLRPKISFGYTANVNLSAAGVTTISSSNSNNYFPGVRAQISTPGDPDLRWEKTKIINAGMDFGLIKNIVSGTLEFYWKKGIDLFGSSPLAPSTGLISFFGNAASTQGKGLDLQINSININQDRFKWASTLMFSHVLDKVTKYNYPAQVSTYFGTNSYGDAIVPIIGAPVFSIYSFKWAGLTHDTGDPQGIVNGKPSTDYNAIVSSTKIDSLQFSGSSRPTTFGSFRNTFTYGKLSVSFNLTYKFNYYFRKTVNDQPSTGGYGSSYFSQAWQKPGDERITNVPSIDFPPIVSNRTFFYQNSAVTVDKGDQVRLQDITLSYELNHKDWQKSPFAHLRFYVNVNNLGILWRANKDHLDPDLFSGGSTGLVYPTPMTFSIGLNAGF